MFFSIPTCRPKPSSWPSCSWYSGLVVRREGGMGEGKSINRCLLRVMGDSPLQNSTEANPPTTLPSDFAVLRRGQQKKERKKKKDTIKIPQPVRPFSFPDAHRSNVVPSTPTEQNLPPIRIIPSHARYRHSVLSLAIPSQYPSHVAGCWGKEQDPQDRRPKMSNAVPIIRQSDISVRRQTATKKGLRKSLPFFCLLPQ